MSNCRRNKSLVLSCFTLIVLCVSTAKPGVVCQEKKTDKGTLIEVSTPWYKVAIDPQKTGQIASWVPVGTGEELVNSSGMSVANFGTLGNAATEFALPWEYEVKEYIQINETAPEKVEVILKSGESNTEALEGFEFRKTIVFRSSTSYIQVRMEAINHGVAKNAFLRIYNDFSVSNSEASSFQQTQTAILNNPAKARQWETWKDAFKGWGGVNTGNGMFIITRMNSEIISDVFTYTNESQASYEVRFKPYTMEKGETAVIADVFLTTVKAQSIEDALELATAKENYTEEVKTIAETKPVERNVDVVLDENSRHILITGRNTRYGFYGIEPALSGSSELARLIDVAPLIVSSTTQLFGFPVSAKGFAKYRMIVLIDMPYFALPDAGWNMIEKFVKAGGTVVFVGDHAADYEDKKITEIMPAIFDHSKAITAGPRKWKAMDDRSAYANLAPEDTTDSLVKGLDFGTKPQVCVHKAVARKEATVHLKAEQLPVLTSWKVGKGMVYSFPICLTDKYNFVYDNDEPEYHVWRIADWDREKMSKELLGEREKSIFKWHNYSDLWQRLAQKALYGKQTFAELAEPVDKAASFEIIAGHHKGLTQVYRRDYEVPFEITFKPEAKGELSLQLIDPWDKVVWKKKLKAQGTNAGVVPLKGLAVGHYVLKSQLGNQSNEWEFDIMANLGSQDKFYVTTLDSVGLCTDDPKEQAKLAQKVAAEGLNLIRGTTGYFRTDMLRWPGRYRRAWGDKIMQAGMEPLHYDGSIVSGCGYGSSHKTDEQFQQDIRASQGYFEYCWAMAPDGIQTYVYDEPGHLDFVKDCPQCNAEYIKQYDGQVPKEGEPGYYRLAKIMDRAFIDALVRKGKIWKDTGSKMKLWGLTNEGSGLMEHALFMSRAFGGYGMDFFSYSPSNWKQQYAFDMALAATDYDPAELVFQIEADSFYGGTPIATQRGQTAYSCLARGCRVLQWHEWDYSIKFHDLGIKPERYEYVKRATGESHKIGPVLVGMKRPKGKIAMLVPSAVQYIADGQPRQQNDKALADAYKAAQVSCGNVDFLYYQHLREGKLNEYKIMLLAGNDWIDDEMIGIIEKWATAGGTLLVVPKSGSISADSLEPTKFLSETCPIKYGDKIEDAWVKGFKESMEIAYALESSTGKAMYSYTDEKPAAYHFKHGSGQVVVFGFVPASSKVLEKIFSDLKFNPAIARSNDTDASAFLLKSGKSYYCVAVNSEEKAKDVELTLDIEGPCVPVAIDMLTGRKIDVSRDANGRVKMNISLEPFWGRAIALLSSEPKKVSIEIPKKARRGGELVYHISVLNDNDNVILARIPLDISVVDGSGRPRPECGGYHVTKDGIYKYKIRLGTNDPTGKWKIKVVASWSGIETKSTFKVVNGYAGW